MLEAIREVHQASRGTYGAPRITAALRQGSWRCGRHRVARLMQWHGITARCYRRYRRRSWTSHGRTEAQNLLAQRFQVTAPDTVWAGDLTCFWTGSGWLYLAVVLDLYSRRLIGWAMGNRMTEGLAIAALRMALGQRQPKSGLLHHSDSEYVVAGCSSAA